MTPNFSSSEEWNQLILSHAARSGAFLQSWQWGEMYAASGHTINRWGTAESWAQLIHMPLPLNKYYQYIPRGPIGTSTRAEQELLGFLRNQYSDALFLRADNHRSATVSIHSPTYSVPDVQPCITLIADLSLDTEQSLSKMRPKTRYNIRLSQKKKLKIHIGDTSKERENPQLFTAFYTLIAATARRHGFQIHSKKHFQAILNYLDGTVRGPLAFLALVSHDDDILAANLMLQWGDTLTYLHGGSSRYKRHLMASYLLHWTLMQYGKKQGLRYYDWWGIAPVDQARHRLHSVTQFKTGFGGEILKMAGTMDFVIRPGWYTLYRWSKRIPLSTELFHFNRKDLVNNSNPCNNGDGKNHA